MAAFGPDFRKYTSPFLYVPNNPAGLWSGLGFLLLIGMVYLVLQSIVGLAISILGFQAQWDDQSALIKASIIGVFPASIPIAAFVWWVSKYRGGVPRDVLALRLPHLGWLGWPLVVFGFVIVMYMVVIAIVYVFQIDLSQFQMGADGEMEAQDLVKQGMIELAKQPMLYWLAFLSVAVGAPIGEELIFRGYMFSLLSNSRVGLTGATLVTSAFWALLHKGTGPWFLAGVLFVMGIVLCCLLIRFGSLWVTLICHGVWNTFTALTIFGVASQ
jgi:membrane protease YdiL (CAAX protease family)